MSVDTALRQPETRERAARVGIIGLGHVGSLTSRVLAPVASTVEYDRKMRAPYPADELAACDLAVVCVDTPSADDRACDVSNVWAAVSRLPVERVLLRSTVPPGTTDALTRATGKAICFWPEYVGETPFSSAYWSDDGDMPFVVLGGAPHARRELLDDLVPLLGRGRVYHECSAVEAELVKYMENAFLATKVTFVNEFYELCKAFGADWDMVRQGWLLDPRVGRSHSAVFPEARGFGGRCLPKDMQAIVAAARDAGCEPGLLQAVLGVNERLRELSETDGDVM